MVDGGVEALRGVSPVAGRHKRHALVVVVCGRSANLFPLRQDY